MGLEVNGTNFVASANIGQTTNVKTKLVDKLKPLWPDKIQYPPLVDPETLIPHYIKMLQIEKYIDQIVDAKYPITDSQEKNKEREAYRATIVEFFKMISPEYKAWKELNDKIFNRKNTVSENETDTKGTKKPFEIMT